MVTSPSVPPASLGRRRFRGALSSLAVAVPVLALALAAAGFTTHKQASTYKVALVGPYTGVFAPSTTGFQNSAKAKFDIVNKQGGVNGHQIEFITQDDGGQPQNTLQQVRSLRDQGVHVFIAVYSAGVAALRPIMDGSFILFTANPPKEQNDPTIYPWDFNFFPPNNYAISADVKYAKKLNATKWAIVADTTAQFQEYVDLLKAAASSAGAQIVL